MLKRFHCSPQQRPWWGRLSSCSTWKPVMEQISTCCLWMTQCWSSWMPKGGCDPVRILHWSRFAGRICGPAVNPHWNTLFLKSCAPGKGLIQEEFVRNYSLMEGLTLEKFMEDCLPWGSPHAKSWEEKEESSTWGGRRSRNNTWWGDYNTHSTTCTSGGEKVGKIRNEVKPKKWEVQWRCFKMWLHI